MWFDEMVKKGIDKSLTFINKVAPKEGSTEAAGGDIPKAPPGTFLVVYRIKEAPSMDSASYVYSSKFEDSGTGLNYYLSRGPTVAAAVSSFPVPCDKQKCFFRFKSFDDSLGHPVWVEDLRPADLCPVYQGSICMEVLLCPVVVGGKWDGRSDEGSAERSDGNANRYSNGKSNDYYDSQPNHSTNPSPQSSSRSAVPNREDLVRVRQEREAAQIQSARDFAKSNAQLDSEKRQSKLDVQSLLSSELDRWALVDATGGKFKDVRSLLSSVESVLWPNSGWEPITMGELMMNESSVKKCYRRAIIMCHPDRHQQASVEQQYRADRIFNAINESFKSFSKGEH